MSVAVHIKFLRNCLISTVMLLLGTFAPQSALAQGAFPVSLLADTIDIDQTSGSLTATGNVQVFFEGRVLKATSITYNATTDIITAEGPIIISDPDGSIIIAEFGQLSSDLKEGLVQGAKVLLAEQFQLAVTEIKRTENRFDTMSNVVASACQVCASRPTPVWQIRAKQVIRDDQEKQIHFRNATFEVFGVPVFYLPYMRIPDPSVKRASGFLNPTILSSEFFGDGIKIPYYHVIADNADATVTSTLTFDGAIVVDAEYRHRFENGGIDLFGAFAIDDALGQVGRGVLQVDGNFTIFDDVLLEFTATAPSDDGFLRQYDYDDTDRLVSEISASRYQENRYFSIASAIMTSLRDDENDNEIPFVFPEFSYRSYGNEGLWGSKYGYELSSVGLFRNEGRDVFRLGAAADLNIPVDLPFGIRATGFANIEADFYRVWNSLEYPERVLLNVHPTIGADIRWPLESTEGNTRQTLEPVVQLLYTADPAFNDLVPNEDSQQVEFDETNLFDLNRFPGRDANETGVRANVGATYSLETSEGWKLGLAGGLVMRSEPSSQFAEDTLLGGSRSDILGAVRLELPPNFDVIGRFLFDDDFEFKRSETQFALSFDKWDIGGSFVYLAPDSLAQASVERGEGSISAEYRIAENWALDFDWTQDLLENKSVFGSTGIRYGNECIEIGVTLSRRFTSSDNVTPSTDIDLTFKLAGFGGSSVNKWPAERCVY